MTAIASLLTAVLVALYGGGSPWLVALTVVAAALAGTTLPDIDAALGLGHRSALLHSVLPAVVAAAADRRCWPVAAGLGLGVGLHMAADLFPNGMRGYATIKVPFWGSIGAWPSYGWIAVNAALALAGGAWLLGQVAAPRFANGTLLAVGLLGAAYLFRTDGGWWALMMFAGLGWLAMR